MSDSAAIPVDAPSRSVDWYELFFDLVFVVVIAVSAHLIEVDTSLATVVAFVLLLFPIWWAWVGLMLTNNLFGERSTLIGALLVLAMPGPAAMAIGIALGIEHNAWLYAAGAVWIRLVLFAMWLVPYLTRLATMPLWRPIAYSLVPAAIWLVSIAVPQPWQFGLWAIAVVIEVVLLSVRTGLSDESYTRASIGHVLERIGLFVVIVIGEAVYLSVTGLAEHATVPGGAAALFGFVVCALLARAFFRGGVPTAEAGLVAAQQRRAFGAMRTVVMYLPFLLVVGLTLIAATIGIAVEHGDEPLALEARILVAVGVAAFYATNALAGLRLGRPMRGVLTLLIPALVLPTAASLLTGGLPAWATLAGVAIAVALLDRLGAYLHARTAAAID